MDNFTTIVEGGHQDEDLVNDGWTHIFRSLAPSGEMVKKFNSGSDAARNVQLAWEEADNMTMERIRRRVDSIVHDPEKAKSLKAWYRRFCKRPCFHDVYLDIFNRNNVTLVDTDGRGVERITENGIVANGEEIELDCIVYATGFEYGTDYSRRLGATVRGRNGVKLSDHFKNGFRSLHGYYVRGFPNYFIISLSQSGGNPNQVFMLNEQAKHLAWLMTELKARNATKVEASEQAEQTWVETIVELAKLRESFFRECTPSFFNDEGKLTTKGILQTRYGLGTLVYMKLIEEWKQEGDFRGLEIDGKLLTDKPIQTRPTEKNVEQGAAVPKFG